MEADGGGENGQEAGAEAAAAAVAAGEIIEPPVIMDGADGDAAAAIAAADGVDWDDRLSWEDSERFEEDSLCSWLSEPESLIQNWRGWSSANTATESGNGGHHPNANSARNGSNSHGGGAGMSSAAASSHRHHHHHSASGRGGACASPTPGHHHLTGGSHALNYNGGLLSVGQPAGARLSTGQGTYPIALLQTPVLHLLVVSDHDFDFILSRR